MKAQMSKGLNSFMKGRDESSLEKKSLKKSEHDKTSAEIKRESSMRVEDIEDASSEE